jgi:putative intracellular protease/amidase
MNPSLAAPYKILLIVTSHAQLGATGQPTGFWLEELAAPYLELTRAGAEVDIASPRGGEPPADPKRLGPQDSVTDFLADAAATHKLRHTRRLEAVTETYDAYFVVGGHGVLWDLAADAALQRLLGKAFDDGKVVAAVCHGPAALIDVKLRDGWPLVKGRRVAGFSNEEETAVGLDKVVPYLLQDKLEERGGHYRRGPMWAPFAVRDGRLVTGQNPASSTATARETLAALAESRPR